MSLTPQISDDGWISLDISPVLTALKEVDSFNSSSGISSTSSASSNSGSSGGGSASANALDLDTKQASTIVRLRDGYTVVIGGLIQTQNAVNKTKVPLLGDIPLLGKLFTGTFHYQQKQELVIFVTPHVVGVNEPSVTAPQIGAGFPTNYLGQPMGNR